MCCVQSLSSVQLCGPLDYSPPGSSAHGIFQQEHCSWKPFPTQRHLPDPGIESALLVSPAVAGGFLSIGQSVSSVTQSCPTLCDPMDCSMPGLPAHHQLPKSAQTHVHQVGDVIQSSHPLASPSPLCFNLSQHQGLFQRVSSSHQVAKVSKLQLQHQSF